MFIPRAVSDACSSSGVACSSSSPDTTPSDTSSGMDPSLMERPGARRYIGIAMVLGLFLIIFLAWLYLGKWPRRIFRQYCCCSKRLPKPIDNVREDAPTPAMSSEKDSSIVGSSEKGLSKEVSGGMVVFTQVPKALGAKDRYPVEWEMDHVHGIKLETRIPQRHHARNASRQS
ncbi:hypothetical protein BYT27DRAFT_7256058 [Phlegmacium glaucopus]|nr:hypothetical protein BYT27DRAFT_7256058 [Phlegmacium glaucopus]